MATQASTTSTVATTTTTKNSTDASVTASSSYLHVTHKKQSGTVILNEAAFTFYPAKTKSGSADDSAPPEKDVHVWTTIAKHQVSPVSHPRNLLRILLHKQPQPQPSSTSTSTSQTKKSSAVALTYEFSNRSELERIRKDVSSRLVSSRRVEALNVDTMNGNGAANGHSHGNADRNGSRKRKLGDVANSGMCPDNDGIANANDGQSHKFKESFTSLTPTEHSVTCSSILASDANTRTQHTLLATKDTNSNNGEASQSQAKVHMGEEDFWSTHTRKVSNQSAKILGLARKGLSSEIKSSLTIQITGNVSKPIQLGVEEMRQIFIMYPAVHAAYEEKVPLELSEEQFWRKYLESEYFHRDRGRIGVSAKSVSVGDTSASEKAKEEEEANKKTELDKKDMTDAEKKSAKEEENKAAKEREETARMGAASSNDIFSRKDAELKQRKEAYAAAAAAANADGTSIMSEGYHHFEQQVMPTASTPSSSLQQIAIGQFDLTSTAQTERGSKLLLLNSSADLHPSDDRGKKVIEKYNRHWTMVLNPDQATAGRDLTALARQSSRYAIENDDDAKVHGGVGREFQRLVGYANASNDRVNHVRMMGTARDDILEDDDYHDNGMEQKSLFEELTLRNVDAYAGSSRGGSSHDENSKEHGALQQRNAAYANIALDQVQTMIKPLVNYKMKGEVSASLSNLNNSFPDPKLGRDLLMALTKHMVLDAMTDKDTKKMTRALPTEFRNKLTSYTRRSSELLRHFFALRHVIDTEKKLKKLSGKSNSSSSKSSEKLKKIVAGMEGVYREMEGMRKELPQTELGEQMRKMCLPIMEQLDCAFQLNRDSSGSGFVTVED